MHSHVQHLSANVILEPFSGTTAVVTSSPSLLIWASLVDQQHLVLDNKCQTSSRSLLSP